MKQIRVSDYIAAVPAIVLLIILIASPARAVEYAKIGTSTCLTTIIPTLFPFFVVSSFFIKSSASAVLSEDIRLEQKPLQTCILKNDAQFLRPSTCCFTVIIAGLLLYWEWLEFFYWIQQLQVLFYWQYTY